MRLLPTLLLAGCAATSSVIRSAPLTERDYVAIAALRDIYGQSQTKHQEFTGGIYFVGGAYIASEPQEGTEETTGGVRLKRAGLVAWYHTHVRIDNHRMDLTAADFSPEDVAFSNTTKLDAYMIDASGVVWLYVASTRDFAPTGMRGRRLTER